MRKEPLERFVVKAAIEKALNKDTIERLTQKLLAYQSRENTRLPVLPAALKDVNKPIENIVSAIEQGIIIPATKQRLDDWEEQRKALETNILQEQIAKPLLTRKQSCPSSCLTAGGSLSHHFRIVLGSRPVSR